MKKIIPTTLLFVAAALLTGSVYVASGQTFSVTPKKMETTGAPGAYIEDAKAEVKNLTGNNLQIRIQRIRAVLPENWFVSFCLVNCYSPDAVDVTDELPPNGTFDFKPSFETPSVPGSAEVEYALSSVDNPSEKYTLVFRATTSTTGAQDRVPLPRNVTIAQNYPNPFVVSELAVTTIGYAIPRTGPVSIKVYNLLGRELRTLVQDVKTAGSHVVAWDGLDQNGAIVPQGIYVYKISSAGSSISRRMLVAR